MSRFLGIPAMLAGLLAVVIGLFLQGGGADAVVFCSVIGGGILLVVAGFAVWAFHAWTHTGRTPITT